MLQPIKATTATQATQATEASESSESIKPISEQRPGQTLRDRLMQPIDATSKKSTSTTEAKTVSQYQQYSMAKYLPATPISLASSKTPESSASTAGTYSNFYSKYDNWADYWTGLGAFQKQTSVGKVYVHDKYGEGLIDADLEPYVAKYGLSKGVDFLRSLANADKLQEDRQNPFYQPITTKNLDRYWYDHESMATTSNIKIGSKGGGQSGKLNGMDISLGKSEIETIRQIAESNGLGQSGFQDLLDRAAKAKYNYAATGMLEKVKTVMSNPATSDWNLIGDNMHMQSRFAVSDFEGLSKTLSEIPSSPISAGVGGAAGEISRGVGDILFNGSSMADVFGEALTSADLSTPIATTTASWLGGAMAVAGFVSSYFEQKKVAKWENARFTPIKNGKLAMSINDYSGSEKNNIKEISEAAGISVDQMVQALAALQISALYRSGSKIESISNSYADSASSDQNVIFGDGSLTLSKNYNRFASV